MYGRPLKFERWKSYKNPEDLYKLATGCEGKLYTDCRHLHAPYFSCATLETLNFVELLPSSDTVEKINGHIVHKPCHQNPHSEYFGYLFLKEEIASKFQALKPLAPTFVPRTPIHEAMPITSGETCEAREIHTASGGHSQASASQDRVRELENHQEIEQENKKRVVHWDASGCRPRLPPEHPPQPGIWRPTDLYKTPQYYYSTAAEFLRARWLPKEGSRPGKGSHWEPSGAWRCVSSIW